MGFQGACCQLMHNDRRRRVRPCLPRSALGVAACWGMETVEVRFSTVAIIWSIVHRAPGVTTFEGMSIPELWFTARRPRSAVLQEVLSLSVPSISPSRVERCGLGSHRERCRTPYAGCEPLNLPASPLDLPRVRVIHLLSGTSPPSLQFRPPCHPARIFAWPIKDHD